MDDRSDRDGVGFLNKPSAVVDDVQQDVENRADIREIENRKATDV